MKINIKTGIVALFIALFSIGVVACSTTSTASREQRPYTLQRVESPHGGSTILYRY